MSKSAIFDHDAIRDRLAQLRGEAPSGRRFNSDGTLAHGYDPMTDRCPSCLASHEEILDEVVSNICPGAPFGDEVCISCGVKAVLAYDSGTECYACGNCSEPSFVEPIRYQPPSAHYTMLIERLVTLDAIERLLTIGAGLIENE